MFVIRFSRADLARVRFAISPLFELHASVQALRHPSAKALHLPWIQAALRSVEPRDLALLWSLRPDNVYTPDFVNPPPRSPLAELDDELEEMLSTPPDQVRAEVRHAYRRGKVPRRLSEFIDDPVAAVERLVGVTRRYWENTLEPHWGRLRALLEGDVLYRARQMADGGAQQLFSDLHPELRFDGEALRIEKPWEDDLALDGRGLLLMPSAFVWPKLAAIHRGPWQPTLIYPARGIGTLWEPGAAGAPDALAALLGRRRAAVLLDLDAPRSTTEVAHRLGLSAASVSQHLAVLREAGLVQASRVRRLVLYARTSRGNQLLET